MASRLSEDSLREAFDSGLNALPWQVGVGSDSNQPTQLPIFRSVDLSAMLESPQARDEIQALPPQLLYQAMAERGLDDCLDVLPLVSRDQMERIFDFSSWRDQRLVRSDVFRWLTLFRQVSREEMYRRFRDLEEEIQIALLQPILRMYDDTDYEKMTDEEQDSLSRMPCGKVFYRVESNDPSDHQVIESLMQVLVSEDLPFAYSLIANAAFSPPQESEEQAAQFRKARLEEDGFVTHEDGLKPFIPADPHHLRREWLLRLAATAPKDQQGLETIRTGRFLEQVLDHARAHGGDQEEIDHVSQRLMHLVNTIAAGLRMEPADVESMRRLLEQVASMTSLGLEYIAAGQPALGWELLRFEHPQMLFRSALGLVEELRLHTLKKLREQGVATAEYLGRIMHMQKYGEVLLWIDRRMLETVGFENAELLKGLFNRFPMRPVTRTTLADGAERVIFTPLATLTDLRALQASLEQHDWLEHKSPVYHSIPTVTKASTEQPTWQM